MASSLEPVVDINQRRIEELPFIGKGKTRHTEGSSKFYALFKTPCSCGLPNGTGSLCRLQVTAAKKQGTIVQSDGACWARLYELCLLHTNGGECDKKKPTLMEVHEFLLAKCQTAPGKNDVTTRYRGPYLKESAQKLFRYARWDELWKLFRGKYPAIAAKITRTEQPDKCPRAFRDLAPWYICKGRRDTCL